MTDNPGIPSPGSDGADIEGTIVTPGGHPVLNAEQLVRIEAGADAFIDRAVKAFTYESSATLDITKLQAVAGERAQCLDAMRLYLARPPAEHALTGTDDERFRTGHLINELRRQHAEECILAERIAARNEPQNGPDSDSDAPEA